MTEHDGFVIDDEFEINDSVTKDHLSRIQWRTKDGELIYLSDMEESHLRNCALFLTDFGYQRCVMPEHRRLIWLRVLKMEWERRMRVRESGNKKFRLQENRISQRFLQ